MYTSYFKKAVYYIDICVEFERKANTASILFTTFKLPICIKKSLMTIYIHVLFLAMSVHDY